MAWELLEWGPIHGVTGDEPFDEMRNVVKRIQRSCLKGLGRNLYFAELLRTLLAIVEADPPAYVADVTLPTLERPVEPKGRVDMAWEEFERDAVRGVIGDEPFDEMRVAVKRIRRSYLERFGRNPYFAELLHPLLAIVDIDPPAYVADTKLPTLEQLVELMGVDTAIEHIDPGYYEGHFDGESDDFLVFPRVTDSRPRNRDSAVLRGQVIESGDNSIVCRYTVLSPSITDGGAKSLIRQCVLQDLMDHNIVDNNLIIRFERTS